MKYRQYHLAKSVKNKNKTNLAKQSYMLSEISNLTMTVIMNFSPEKQRCYAKLLDAVFLVIFFNLYGLLYLNLYRLLYCQI